MTRETMAHAEFDLDAAIPIDDLGFVLHSFWDKLCAVQETKDNWIALI